MEATRERSFANFRFGPQYPTRYPGGQFPVEAQDQYYAQLVPNTETMLAGGIPGTSKGRNTTPGSAIRAAALATAVLGTAAPCWAADVRTG